MAMNKRAKILWAVLAGIPLAGMLALGGWTAATLGFAYSKGERAGYMQKISNKGWVCKTWEGELALATVPGSMPVMWSFSVRDEAVAKKIESLQGERVVLDYEQHKGVPTDCFGETEYFVTGARKAGG